MSLYAPFLLDADSHFVDKIKAEEYKNKEKKEDVLELPVSQSREEIEDYINKQREPSSFYVGIIDIHNNTRRNPGEDIIRVKNIKIDNIYAVL